jgi:hypothetical protein
MLNGFATPSRIFGLAFRLKKYSEKKSGIFLNLLQITLFYGTSCTFIHDIEDPVTGVSP